MYIYDKKECVDRNSRSELISDFLCISVYQMMFFYGCVAPNKDLTILLMHNTKI